MSNMSANIVAQTLGSINSKITGEAQADKVAKQFEQMVLSQLLSFSDTDNDMSDSEFGGGAGERAFKPFLYDEYAKAISHTNGVGIATAVKGEILKIQEAAQKTQAIPLAQE